MCGCRSQFIEFLMESKGKTRTFIGIPVEVPDPLADVMSQLQKLFVDERIRWVPLNQMHITLRFLGDISTSDISTVSARLKTAYRREAPITIFFRGLGTFGHRSDLSVLWAGIDGEEHIVRLRKTTDHCLAPIFPDVERRAFRPHLTLARMKNLKQPRVFRSVVECHHDKEFGTSVLSRIIFYKSILLNGGPQYEPLEEVLLGQD
jgi:RNA 2',3'-cyclic 3'-phosphodiesterase